MPSVLCSKVAVEGSEVERFGSRIRDLDRLDGAGVGLTILNTTPENTQAAWQPAMIVTRRVNEDPRPDSAWIHR